MNWLMMVRLKPMKTVTQPIMPQRSLYMRPNILGHQWCMPPTNAMMVPPIMT